MELKAIFGILSAFFTFAGLVPYFLEIRKKEIYPHNLSWLGWAFITLVGGIAMLADGWSWSIVIIFTNTLSCILIVLYSLYKKVGIWSTTKYDYVFFGLGILGIILWQTFSLPIIAIACAVLADLFFGIPTLIKAYKNPKTELPIAWLSCSVAGLLSLFAVQGFAVSEFMYPLYLFIYDTVLFLIIVIHRNRKIVSI